MTKLEINTFYHWALVTVAAPGGTGETFSHPEHKCFKAERMRIDSGKYFKGFVKFFQIFIKIFF